MRPVLLAIPISYLLACQSPSREQPQDHTAIIEETGSVDDTATVEPPADF